jgi:hypothetical protein
VAKIHELALAIVAAEARGGAFVLSADVGSGLSVAK